MDKVSGRLTVFFQEPFWMGVFERISDGELTVCKVTFGSEPRDCEIQTFILKNYARLRYSPAVTAAVKKESLNPKRRLREVRKRVRDTGVGTKSQQALKLQQEQAKEERINFSRRKQRQEKERAFELKQQKKKEKHRGR